MSFWYALSLESLVDCINKKTLTPQYVLAIRERLEPKSGQSSTELTSTTAIDQVSYWRVCVDLAPTTSKCPHFSNPDLFLPGQNHNSRNKPRGCTDENLNGRYQRDCKDDNGSTTVASAP